MVSFLKGFQGIEKNNFFSGLQCAYAFFLITFCLNMFVIYKGISGGIEKAWEEIHHGADIRVPKIYKFIIRYVTPVFLFLILGFWLYQEGISTILMKNVSQGDKPYILGARLMLLGIFIALAILVKIAWGKRKIRVKK